MKKQYLILLNLIIMYSTYGTPSFEKDTFVNQKGNLIITFIGHGTLMIEYNNKVIHVDPWSKLADYKQLPKADIVLITHHHQDHLDAVALNQIKKESTILVGTRKCKELNSSIMPVTNGESAQFGEIFLYAIPAYNIVQLRPDNTPFHPKGEGNGYLLDIDNLRIYIAGDTENIPEMKNIKNVDIAFLPCNLPYTMTVDMFVEAISMIKPKIVYPYHYGETNLNEIINKLGLVETEIRIRKMK